MNINILHVDYNNPQQASDFTQLLNSYAQDPLGNNASLSQNTLKQLCPRLAKLPHAHSFMCYVDDKPAGLLNCFEGFSTFKAQALLNIHDVFIAPTFRGLGLSIKLLKQAETLAEALDCCKITLEVSADNNIAQQAYIKFGFIACNTELSPTYFWHKSLNQHNNRKD